jgi:hypothetical protein
VTHLCWKHTHFPYKSIKAPGAAGQRQLRHRRLWHCAPKCRHGMDATLYSCQCLTRIYIVHTRSFSVSRRPPATQTFPMAAFDGYPTNFPDVVSTSCPFRDRPTHAYSRQIDGKSDSLYDLNADTSTSPCCEVPQPLVLPNWPGYHSMLCDAAQESRTRFILHCSFFVASLILCQK